MKKIFVNGGCYLNGRVEVSSAKNATLPIMAASILADSPVDILNIPVLDDVYILKMILEDIGCDVNLNLRSQILSIDSTTINRYTADCELVKKMRGSFLIMGPMLAKYKKFTLACPGGCNIGSRPIDLHLKGFEALGARVTQTHGFIEIECEKLQGTDIYLDFPSVGATENIMMCASIANGRTIINNPALEPEIEDLANFLNSMGAKIQFNMSSRIIIDGVSSLNGTSYKPIYDRIEAGTFMIAAAVRPSNVKIVGVEENHLKPVIEKLKDTGCEFSIDPVTKIATINGCDTVMPTDIITLPHPGYPTDMQSQMMSLLAIANGTSIIEETVFENRFMNISEMIKMGANIKLRGNSAIIKGVDGLTGAKVSASDLRAGAALIIAGIIADGVTEIDNIHHIDRGYMNIEQKFKKIGVDIERV